MSNCSKWRKKAVNFGLSGFIAGAEDVQTGRYAHIFLTDTSGNRYAIPNSEALDLTSRRMAERFFRHFKQKGRGQSRVLFVSSARIYFTPNE
ncbi:MAG: DUF1854 domain-containing protein [Armatimonadetes bacterium]|nr:DUF1854 domain-containing protein [Armatimonadota bacterium]